MRRDIRPLDSIIVAALLLVVLVVGFVIIGDYYFHSPIRVNETVTPPAPALQSPELRAWLACSDNYFFNATDGFEHQQLPGRVALRQLTAQCGVEPSR